MLEKMKRILDHYGDLHQKVKALEEMSELGIEIVNDVQGEANIEHITEEIADVYVTLRQLMIIHGITTEEVLEIAGQKVERQLKRMAADGR